MIDRSRALAIAALLAFAAGCGGTSGASASLEPSASLDPDALRYACGQFPFTPELLTAPPRNDEDADGPIADALRRHLAQPGPDVAFLPDHGWTLAGQDSRSAEYVTVAGDLGMKSVELSNDGDWQVTAWGDCRPQIVLAPGLGVATWEWGSDGLPDPSTQTFDAVVTEMACASGQSSEGRVVGPLTIRGDTQVLVIFAVRSLGGGTCPSNPSTRVHVDLGEPLGDRDLLDASQLPFNDPTKPRF